MSTGELFLADENATEAAGAALARVAAGGGLVTVSGELGAGKTMLVRGLLRALGHRGVVKSPTYTLVEPYELDGLRVLHLDLYRLAAARDLEPIGVRDEFGGDALIVIEWPERADGALPHADLEITLDGDGAGRTLRWRAHSERFAQAFDS